jgi:hypothetical protein
LPLIVVLSLISVAISTAQFDYGCSAAREMETLGIPKCAQAGETVAATYYWKNHEVGEDKYRATEEFAEEYPALSSPYFFASAVLAYTIPLCLGPFCLYSLFTMAKSKFDADGNRLPVSPLECVKRWTAPSLLIGCSFGLNMYLNVSRRSVGQPYSIFNIVRYMLMFLLVSLSVWLVRRANCYAPPAIGVPYIMSAAFLIGVDMVVKRQGDAIRLVVMLVFFVYGEIGMFFIRKAMRNIDVLAHDLQIWVLLCLCPLTVLNCARRVVVNQLDQLSVVIAVNVITFVIECAMRMTTLRRDKWYAQFAMLRTKEDPLKPGSEPPSVHVEQAYVQLELLHTTCEGLFPLPIALGYIVTDFCGFEFGKVSKDVLVYNLILQYVTEFAADFVVMRFGPRKIYRTAGKNLGTRWEYLIGAAIIVFFSTYALTNARTTRQVLLTDGTCISVHGSAC